MGNGVRSGQSGTLRIAQRFSCTKTRRKTGKDTLTIAVLPIEPEHRRLTEQRLMPGPIEPTKDLFIMRLTDPDGNLSVMASAKRS